MEIAKPIQTGFSTADAEYPEIHQKEGNVILRFKDWQEKTVEVFFSDPVALRWQAIESLLEGERNDSSYEIEDSLWLAEHVKQSVISKLEAYKHYKFNFNECGQFEILANGFSTKI